MSNDHYKEVELVGDSSYVAQQRQLLSQSGPTNLQLIVNNPSAGNNSFRLEPNSVEVTRLLVQQARLLTW